MDVFDLFAKITLDIGDYTKGLNNAAKKVSDFAGKVGKGFNAVSGVGEKVLSGFKTAASVAATGVAAVTGAVAALGKSSIEAYADYEQLVGGVETLFSKTQQSYGDMLRQGKEAGESIEEINQRWSDSQSAVLKVLENADNAYKTAGLSANEYMETVTSFSASLLQGLGGDTDKAAEIANRAITDMSDNANKMGTSIEMIQNAYQGFAKQNYTMLDNLKLGYGGTASEMARLVNDSGVLGDTLKVTAKTVNNVSFDKIIEAIGVVQDRIGITGTTAKEASETISGSIASMKSAWKNLLAGFGNEDADLGQLVDNVVEGFGTVAKNVMPRVEAVARGIVKAIPNLVKSIAEILPEFLEIGVEAGQSLIDGFGEILPDLISAGGNAIENIATGIAGNIGAVIDGITSVVSQIAGEIGKHKDELKTAGSTIIHSLAEGFSGIVNELLPLAQEFIPTFIEGFLTYKETLFTVGLDIITAIANGIAENIDQIVTMGVNFLTNVITAIQENLPMLAEAAITIITGLADGLGEALPNLIPAIMETGGQLLQFLFDGILSGLPLLAQSAVTIMANLGQYLQENLPMLIQSGLEAIVQLTGSIRENAGIIIDGAISLAKSLAQGLADSIPTIIENVPTIVSNIANTINDNAPKILKAAVDIIGTLIKGLISAIPTLIANIPKIISAIVDTITAFNWLNLGKNIINFFSQGIKGMFSSIANTAKGIITSIIDGGGLKNLPKMALQWGKDMLSNFISGIKSKISSLVNSVKNIGTTIKKFIGFSEPKEGPLSNFHTYAPDMMKLFAQGIEENAGLVQRQLDKSLNFDFGTATVDFENSGMGRIAGGITSATRKMAESGSGEIVINLTANLDGTPIYKGALRYAKNQEKAWGMA